MAVTFFDTETIGFHGLMVLLQWSRGDGEIHLHEVFHEKVKDTKKLIDEISSDGVVGFNLAFDWFHMAKMRTILELLDPQLSPIDQLERLVSIEGAARDGWCLKPKSACDLLVQASEGKFQTLMLEHNEIRIRTIPHYMSQWVADLLNQELQFPDIYFARRKDPTVRFQALPKPSRKGFDDVVLKFAPKQDLKSLISHIKDIPTDQFKDIPSPEFPPQVGYKPFQNCPIESVLDHTEFWGTNERAREYARKDVEYTRDLYEAFGRPVLGDLNSVLACMVGVVRWRGFSVDLDQVRQYQDQCAEKMLLAPRDPNSARRFIEEVMDEEEKDILSLSTKKQVLKDLMVCYNGTEVADRAALVLRSRQAKYNHDMCHKLIEPGRFHASAKVIGTLSGRKSGGGGDFNSQGINKATEIRNMYTFAGPGEVLCGGDFKSFEVVIADGFFMDPKLREDLLEGRSIHAIFGTYCFPGMSYEDVIATKGTLDDRFKIAKSAVFLTLYGGSASTYKRNLNIPLDIAEAAFSRFCERYPVLGAKRKEVFSNFEMLSQPGGRGTEVFFQEPKQRYIESMLGFRRSFDPEFEVISLIYHLQQNLPAEVSKFDIHPPIKRTRSSNAQRPSSALQSALYAASFGIQGGVQRASNNHVIQSTGAGICKELETAIWELQPVGFHPWAVAPLNMHDEVMVAAKPEVVPRLNSVVKTTVERHREKIPLLDIDWHNNLGSWGDE